MKRIGHIAYQTTNNKNILWFMHSITIFVCILNVKIMHFDRETFREYKRESRSFELII